MAGSIIEGIREKLPFGNVSANLTKQLVNVIARRVSNVNFDLEYNR